MAVFNFTVRATDSEGSYADRQFNITVRNSSVERFMVVDNNDAWTSPDGTTWTQRVGQGGVTCEYGNGFWLIKVGQAGNTGFRKSTDGINYNLISSTSIISLESDGSTASTAFTSFNSGAGRLKFWNGLFWLITYTTGSYILWSTADGITWTKKLSVGYTASASPGVDYVPSLEPTIDGDTMFVPFPFANANPGTNNTAFPTSCAGWSTTNGTTFTQIKDISITNQSYGGAQQLMRVNGLYIGRGMNNSSTYSNNYKYSTDGVNWTSVNQPSTFSNIWAASSLFYANGKLYWFSRRSTATQNSGDPYWTSLDGINWTTKYMKLFNQTTSERYIRVMFKNGLFIAMVSVTNGSGDESSDPILPNNGFRVSLDGETWTVVNTRNSVSTTYNDIAAM